MLLWTAACSSCSPVDRTRAVRASLYATNALRDGFVEWDRQHQLALVEKAATREAAVHAVADYREKRAAVVASFELVYRALALAATSEDDQSLRDALTAADRLKSSTTTLMGDGGSWAAPPSPSPGVSPGGAP